LRILLVSDLHYSLPQFDWVVRVGPDYDLVVVAGDSLSIRSAVPLEVQSVTILEYFSLMHSVTRLAVSSGNHDLTGPDTNREQSALWLSEARASGIPTDGDSLEIDGVLVTLCPFWDGPVGRARVAEQLAADAACDAPRHMWVYHWPPTGSPTSWTGRREYGDADLAGWIREHQPDLVLTGHVHESPFKAAGAWADRVGSTWVFNPGNQIGPVPAHIVLDLDAERASWLSMLGSEEIDLTEVGPPSRTLF
jgi:Icc-related predicted phosphoesterase